MTALNPASASRARGNRQPPYPGELLLHPVALAALALLLVNDHLLKAAWPGPLTGKLSDVAGLVILPLFLHSLWLLARRVSRRTPSPAAHRDALGVACLVGGLVFAAVKLTGAGNAAYAVSLGALQWPFAALTSLLAGSPVPPLHPVVLAMDPSDLLAVPALLVPLLLAGVFRYERRGKAHR